jgi:hypothetical protein
MVVAETMMGISGFKATMDMVKALKDIDDRTRRNEIAIELGEKILAAHAAQTALLESESALKKEVAELKAWEADKQRYELKDLWKGFFAYVPKEGMENGEPPHGLCTNCYQKGFKSILQNSGHPTHHDRTWDCHACKTKIKLQSNSMGELIAKSRAPA